MATIRKKILLLCRHSPYDGQLARAGLDAALAASVFEQDLSILFMDEGIWQLLPDQQSGEIGSKSIARTLESMPLYDLDTFHVEAESLFARGVDPQGLIGNTVVLDCSQVPGFIDSFAQVWSF